MSRGDVILVRFPHPSGQRGKKRPAVVFNRMPTWEEPKRSSLPKFTDSVAQVIGTLSPTMKQNLDGCLKAALALP